jgi:DNA-binding CsgD family transcriptional regulator
MVARADALASLNSALAQAAEGSPRIVLVTGEAGLGKTRLAREFVTRVRATSQPVWWGNCVPLQAGALPYAPIVAALRDAGLPAELTDGAAHVPAQPGHAPARLFEQVLRLLGRLAAATTGVLVIEDVHWADAATQDLVRFLAANLQAERLLLLLTVRTDEPNIAASVRGLLAELRRSERTEPVELEPLGEDDTRLQIAGLVGGDATDALAEWVHARAEGNPYFAEELLATVNGREDAGGLPASLREVLLARMAGLPGPSRRVLQVTATAGRAIHHDLLRRAAALEDSDLATALRALLDAHLLVCDHEQERYSFRHALAREAVYGELLPPERRSLHSALASAFADLVAEPGRGGADWATLAQHHDAAGEAGAAVRAYVAAAAAASAMYAYRTAAGHLDRARILWPQVPAAERPDGLDEIEVLHRLADAARLAGDRDGAIPIAEAALAQLDPEADPLRSAAIHTLLGLLHRSRGESLGELERALALLPPEPSPARAAALVLRCFKARYGAPPRRTRDGALEALEAARATHARAEEGRALAMLGFAEAHGGGPDAAIPHLEGAIEIAKELDRGDDLANALNTLAEASMLLGRIEEAKSTLTAGFEAVRSAGLALSDGVLIQASITECEIHLGQWREAEARIQRILTNPSLDGEWRLILTVHRLVLASRQGRVELAAELAAEASALLAANVGPPTVVIANCVLAEFELLRGHPEAARTVVEDTRRTLATGDLLWWPALLTFGIRAHIDLAERARAAGRADEATTARDAALDILGSAETPGSLRSYTFDEPVAEPAPPETQTHWALGEAEISRLDPVQDGEMWAEVAGRWDRLRFPYPAAYARLREAEARLAGAHDRPAAAAALRSAHAALSRLGAAPLREQAEALARRARITLDRPQAPATADRPFDLTARELTVLEHLAAGHTNRHIAEDLYLSTRTVDVHVRHILAKLGASNRVEAATIAHRHGLGSALEDT